MAAIATEKRRMTAGGDPAAAAGRASLSVKRSSSHKSRKDESRTRADN